MVHDQYINAVKIQTASIVSIMEMNAVSEVTKYAEDLRFQLANVVDKQMQNMLLKFDEMKAPEEMVKQYLENMELLLDKTNTAFEAKTKVLAVKLLGENLK